MRAWAKVLSGLGAFTPLLSAVGLGTYIAVVLVLDDMSQGGPASDPWTLVENGPFDTTDLLIFSLAVVAIALFQLVMTLVFSVHAARDPRVRGAALVIWVLAFVLVGAFALPLYFLTHMLREPVRRVELPAIG
jgi:hypothetical protein